MNENLKMSAALLSRFDLAFILLDKPDELLDKRVSDHIMSVSFLVWMLYTGAEIIYYIKLSTPSRNDSKFFSRVFKLWLVLNMLVSPLAQIKTFDNVWHSERNLRSTTDLVYLLQLHSGYQQHSPAAKKLRTGGVLT